MFTARLTEQKCALQSALVMIMYKDIQKGAMWLLVFLPTKQEQQTPSIFFSEFTCRLEERGRVGVAAAWLVEKPAATQPLSGSI